MQRASNTSIALILATLALSGCAWSDDHEECIEEYERVIICPADNVAREVFVSELSEYPDAEPGFCDEPPEDTSWPLFYATNVVFYVLHEGRASWPSRWTICGVMGGLESLSDE